VPPTVSEVIDEAPRATVDRCRASLAGALADGGSGVAACAALSDTYDRVVARAFAAAGGDRPGWALVATGGWGRREVCPYSDIDLLVLAPPRDERGAGELVERLCYPLWDAGFKVGHAVRDPASAAELARTDLATATALLDGRLVSGDRAAADELFARIRRAVAPGGNPNEFVARLAEEKQRRHDRFGDSLYLLEPNLKQGIGGLRDLSTALWAAHARWSARGTADLVAMGALSGRQAGVLGDALDFLLRIRSLVQLEARRPTDQLTFEIQEAIAPRLYPDARLVDGDVRPAVAAPVEQLMRRYYLHARAVVQVADRLLEAAVVPPRKKPRIVRIDASFLLWNGKLAVSDPAVFRDRPAEMLRAFRVAGERRAPVYGHTKELIAETVAERGASLAVDPEAARHFVAALTDLADARQPSLLEEMHQVGLLAAVMPEFAPCTCRVQHDLYHVYTVDQHQLYALALLKRILRGELAATAPLATEVGRQPGDLAPLCLATLLHDVGKPLGKGHAEKGAVVAGAIARRLGLGEAAAERTELLVRQHLTMSHLSQRRDLSDPDVIRRFAERTGSDEALAQLYLLTRVDTEMTSPDNLTAWKDQLLGELYQRTHAHFRGEDSAQRPAGGELERARQRALDLIAAESSEAERAELAGLVAQLDERFVAALSSRQLARHLRLARRKASGAAVELEVACYPMKGVSELAVVADDAPGLLARLAGVLSAHRVAVVAAVVSTVERSPGPSWALDLFHVRDPYGKAIAEDDPRWAAIRADLVALDAGGELGKVLRRRRRSALKPRVTPGVPTTIQVDDAASERFTVVDVATRDRPFVLHAITRALADLGLDIHLAKVTTEGEKVADAFYVSERGGGKLGGAARARAVEEAVAEALAQLAADGKAS
jgi:[protein-PII] uridylyltransferase